jgi:hypothetical protein
MASAACFVLMGLGNDDYKRLKRQRFLIIGALVTCWPVTSNLCCSFLESLLLGLGECEL